MGALCLIATLYDFIFIMMTPDAEEEAEPPMNGHTHSNGDLRKDGDASGADTEILIQPPGKNEAPKHSRSSSNTISRVYSSIFFLKILGLFLLSVSRALLLLATTAF